MSDTLPRARRALVRSELLSTLLGVVFTITYIAIDTRLFSSPPQANWAFRYATCLALSKWALAFYDLWKTFPERQMQRALDDLLKKYPDCQTLVYARFGRKLDALSQEIANLCSDAGERWEANDRLRTANDIFDGCPRITKYVATSTDAPYLPTSETKDFYARQAKKLPRNDSRRLLVYDIETLVTNLTSQDRITNLRAFHRLHLDHGLQLRYWPHSVKHLHDRLKRIVNTSQPPLVDFGVVNEQVAFGQAMHDDDTDRVTGHGRVTTGAGEVARYIEAFDSLWKETAPESFPASHLYVLALLCDMRHRMHSQPGLTGPPFFDYAVDVIRNGSGTSLIAVDVAPDMAVWWREPEYTRFLGATIEAARKGKKCSRMFVFRRRFGTHGEAGVFVTQVIRPQVDAGVEVGVVFTEAALEKDVAIADFVCDDSGWGFYLLPGDRFTTTDVSAARNQVASAMKPELERIHLGVRDLAATHGQLSGTKTPLDDAALATWLLR